VEALMSCIRKNTYDAPSKYESPIEELIRWRTVMERELPYGNIMSLMRARNCVGAYRDRLAPWEWLRCPSCGERGPWVDSGDRDRYCKGCSGTGILLANEQDEPKPEEPVPAGWGSRLRRLGHLDPRRNITTTRRL
jgi:hypothetical protein